MNSSIPLASKKAPIEKETSYIKEKSKEQHTTHFPKKKTKEVKLLEELLSICKKGATQLLLKEKTQKKEEIPLGMTPEIIAPLRKVDLFPETPTSSLMPIDALELIDQVCSEILVMETESSSQTTFILQGERFSNSSFYGAEITIEEFSTAPKLFNISIKTTDSAITIIQTQIAGFLNLLEKRDFSFGINRIDTSLQTESPTGKEKSDQDRQKDKKREQ